MECPLYGTQVLADLESCMKLCVSLFQTPYLYRGERYRNKMDFSLRMYGDEVKVRSLRILTDFVSQYSYMHMFIIFSLLYMQVSPIS